MDWIKLTGTGSAQDCITQLATSSWPTPAPIGTDINAVSIASDGGSQLVPAPAEPARASGMKGHPWKQPRTVSSQTEEYNVSDVLATRSETLV